MGRCASGSRDEAPHLDHASDSGVAGGRPHEQHKVIQLPGGQSHPPREERGGVGKNLRADRPGDFGLAPSVVEVAQTRQGHGPVQRPPHEPILGRESAGFAQCPGMVSAHQMPHRQPGPGVTGEAGVQPVGGADELTAPVPVAGTTDSDSGPHQV